MADDTVGGKGMPPGSDDNSGGTPEIGMLTTAEL